MENGASANLTEDSYRFCVGLEVLTSSARQCNAGANTKVLRALSAGDAPLAAGGAQLILSPARARLWPSVPRVLHVIDAVMGAELPRETIDEMQAWARRHSGASPDGRDCLSLSEIGILLSNNKAWTHALNKGWEWSLILEDDATAQLRGGFDQLLALLPALVEAATAADPDWMLIVLSPWGLEEFYARVEPSRIPSLHGQQRFGPGGCELPPLPAWTRRPTRLNATGWRRVGPTFHAFGWIYRDSLMRLLLDGMRARSPPLNPLDVWVWEVMAMNGVLSRALSPVVVQARERCQGTHLTPAKFDGEFRAALVGTRSMPGSHDSLNRS